MTARLRRPTLLQSLFSSLVIVSLLFPLLAFATRRAPYKACFVVANYFIAHPTLRYYPNEHFLLTLKGNQDLLFRSVEAGPACFLAS